MTLEESWVELSSRFDGYFDANVNEADMVESLANGIDAIKNKRRILL